MRRGAWCGNGRKPFWRISVRPYVLGEDIPESLAWAEAPPPALTDSFSSTCHDIYHIQWWLSISHPGCSHLENKHDGLFTFTCLIYSSFAIRAYQMSTITFILSNHEFLIDRKCTFMILHKDDISVDKEDEVMAFVLLWLIQAISKNLGVYSHAKELFLLDTRSIFLLLFLQKCLSVFETKFQEFGSFKCIPLSSVFYNGLLVVFQRGNFTWWLRGWTDETHYQSCNRAPSLIIWWPRASYITYLCLCFSICKWEPRWFSGLSTILAIFVSTGNSAWHIVSYICNIKISYYILLCQMPTDYFNQ